MTRTALPAAAAVAAFLFAGHGAEAQTSRASRPTGACYSVWLTAPTPPGERAARRRNLEFSAREILDLQLLVLLPLEDPDAPAAGRKIELKLFTPKGHLYQTISMTDSPADPPGASRRRRRYETLTANLPVAGTTIVNNSLYGTWKAEAYVEGETAPCAKGRRFVIHP